jgi:DNA-binding FadR family transcriptional regulator
MPHPTPPPHTALQALTPTLRKGLVEQVGEKLAQTIVERELGPGERLPSERDLAQQLEVSRLVVREALVRLAERGLIDIRQGIGSFVAHLGDATVSEPLKLYIRRRGVQHKHLFELRHALEPAMAAAAARAVSSHDADPEELAFLERNVTQTLALASAPNASEAFAWSDFAFHEALARLSGNPLFELLLAPLVEPLVEVRRRGLRHHGSAQRAASEHQAIWSAIAAGDPNHAARAMEAHLNTVQGWLADPTQPQQEDNR